MHNYDLVPSPPTRPLVYPSYFLTAQTRRVKKLNVLFLLNKLQCFNSDSTLSSTIPGSGGALAIEAISSA